MDNAVTSNNRLWWDDGFFTDHGYPGVQVLWIETIRGVFFVSTADYRTFSYAYPFIENGKVSITPLHRDVTNYAALEALGDREIAL